jgi:hypothetical protein
MMFLYRIFAMEVSNIIISRHYSIRYLLERVIMYCTGIHAAFLYQVLAILFELSIS